MSLETLLKLAHYDPQVRAHGIQSLVSVGSEPFDELIDILVTSMADLEFTVVMAALSAIERLLESVNNGNITSEYKIIKALQEFSLNDNNDKNCRLYSIKVLTHFSTQHADLRLPSHNNKRLHDILFVSFSDLAICSFDPELRAAAFTLIATLHHIDTLLVKQAFTKSRLEDLADVVPDSACGVFVHGMEDEAEAVRLWCVRAVFAHTLVVPATSLLGQDEGATTVVVDCIVDAFLDDAASVRLHAVKTLTSICIIHRVKLDLDRADLTLQLLVDGDPEIRRAVRKLLQVTQLDEQEGVRAAFKAMSRAYSRHPSELEDLMLAAGKIGHNHALLIAVMLPLLLRIDSKYYVPQEPRVEDANYQMILCAILNAVSAASDTIVPSLPAFVFKQYHYMRAKYRPAVPPLLAISDFTNHHFT